MKVLLLTALLLAVVLAGALWFGHWRWGQATAVLETRLEAVRRAPAPARFDARELETLPPPVQRYLRRVLTDGQLIVSELRIGHEGQFNMGEAGENWKPFASRQHVVLQRPGFLWDARVRMVPGFDALVHDAYIAGEGILHATASGLVTLADLRGSGAIAEGELMRWFAETAWYPTALLPSQGVRWQAVDERSARATLRDGEIVTTLTFVFGADGLVEAVRADARGRTVGGTVVPTPWEGRWSDWQPRDGMLVPMAGEVAWITADGRKPYWRARVTALAYQFAR